jgi:hypothetical protein
VTVRPRAAIDLDARLACALDDPGVAPARELGIGHEENEMDHASCAQGGKVPIELAPIDEPWIPIGRAVLARKEGQPEASGRACQGRVLEPIDAKGRVESSLRGIVS